MGKNTAAKGKAPVKDKNNKRKRDDQSEAQQSEAGAGSSLFGGLKNNELDDVFARSATFAPAVPVASTSKALLKSAVEPATKKGKKVKEVVPVIAPVDEEEESDEEDEDFVVDEEEEQSEEELVEDSDEDAGTDVEMSEAGDEDDVSSVSSQELVHESVKAAREARKAKKSQLGKFIPSEESPADKNRRTVFIGGLPNEAAKSKNALKQLKAHIKTFVPTASVESIRFRSVAFAAPTAPVPTDDPEKDANQRAKREKERIAAWRAKQDGVEEDEEADKAKVFIDAKGKRKVAFIKKDFHSEIDSCNAYVVFAHPHPDRAANVAPVQDPYEAATEFIKSANGSTFLSRVIRTDSVRSLPSTSAVPAGMAKNKSNWLPSNTDPKKSLFIGGLDYASKEEDVRVFFEELVKKERGMKEDGEKWVLGVRIVRDKETQLGKGFGYVQFADRESVEEILALDAKTIKFAKRTIRVQPSKSVPTANTLQNTIKKVAAGSTGKDGKPKDKKKKYPRMGVIPKGDPSLGDKLKDLSKEERKAVKSSDSDRQARRMAKKQAKNTMEREKAKTKVKLSLTKAEKEQSSGKLKPKAKKGKKRAPGAIAKMKGSRA